MFNEALLGKTPEALDTVNINFPGSEAFLMVDLQMPITAKHQGIIPLVFVGIDDGAPANHSHRLGQQGFCPDIFQHLHFNQAVPLQDTKNRDLAGSAPAGQ